ncbi:MAG: hypothetical protein EOO96_17545, partial [Pedobacter sp.]
MNEISTQQKCRFQCVWPVTGSKPDNLKKHQVLTNYRRWLKLLSFLLFITFFCTNSVFAQQSQQNITVKGTVLDEDDNQPLIGVTITDGNKKTLGSTNNDGAYSVSVPKGATVVFNMLGFTAVRRVFEKNETNITIRLKSSSSQLNDVVVTALGIKREEKSLGYSTTKVDSSAFTNAVASNWTDALSGKVAGLNLVRNSGPAASNKIILRGENNLTGDNEALIVIDGVVASSSARRTAASS